MVSNVSSNVAAVIAVNIFQLAREPSDSTPPDVSPGFDPDNPAVNPDGSQMYNPDGSIAYNPL